MRGTLGFALVLGLAACAGQQWTKDGVSGETAAADYADCNSLAQAARRHDSTIDTDILASRGHDWEENSSLQTRQQIFAEGVQQSSDIVKACMIGKGYTPRP